MDNMNETQGNEIKISDKQKMFCREYIIDWNGTQAAIRSGYSKKTAYAQASDLLRKPNIKAYLDKLKANIEETLNISALRNVQELMKIAFSDASDLRESYQKLKDFEKLPESVKASIESIEYHKTTFGDNGEKEVFKVKQYSKLDAIKTINNMMGYNAAQKIDLSSKTPVFKMIDVTKTNK